MHQMNICNLSFVSMIDTGVKVCERRIIGQASPAATGDVLILCFNMSDNIAVSVVLFDYLVCMTSEMLILKTETPSQN